MSSACWYGITTQWSSQNSEDKYLERSRSMLSPQTIFWTMIPFIVKILYHVLYQYSERIILIMLTTDINRNVNTFVTRCHSQARSRLPNYCMLMHAALFYPHNLHCTFVSLCIVG